MDFMRLLTFLSFLCIVSGIIRYGCYNSPGSPCIHVTLKCLPNRVVSLENTIQFGSSTDKCTRDDQCLEGSCCTPKNNDVPTLAEFKDRLSVFTSCSNQQSCTITVPYNQSLIYDYVSYSYICLKDESNFDISTKFKQVVKKKQVYLYGNGKNNTSSSSTRICKVQTVKHAIAVKARYINLRSESCRKIKISQNTTLFNCTEERLVILSEKLDITGNQINITIHDLTLQTDEFIWLEFLTDDAADLAIKCEGMESVAQCSNCYNSTSSAVATNSTWIYVVGAGGLVVMIVLVLIVVYIVKGNKSKRSKVNTMSWDDTTERHEPIGKLEDAPNPYAEPREMISLPSTVCHSGGGASPLYYTLEKDSNINNGVAEIPNSTQPEIKKGDHDHGYAQVNKGTKIQTHNHLGPARDTVKEKNGSPVYDHIH